MAGDNAAQMVSAARLHIKLLEEQMRPTTRPTATASKWPPSLPSPLFCADSSTHHWGKVSQLAWSACWALRCIWSPQECPWKIHTVTNTQKNTRQPNQQGGAFVTLFFFFKKALKHFIKWNVPLPHPKTLVVWCTDKSTIFVHEGDGVDGSQVTVVLLYHLACPDVPLEYETGELKTYGLNKQSV